MEWTHQIAGQSPRLQIFATLRIVGGRWKGRRLKPPEDYSVRPTADRVREAWTSIILADLVDARVLDLFAGSGALGLEALSRGARSVDFVESSDRVLKTLRENISALGAEEHSRVHRMDAMRFLNSAGKAAYDVAFADPPYRKDLARDVVLQWQRIPFAAVIGVEHAATEVMPDGGDTRRYGDSAITFYRSDL